MVDGAGPLHEHDVKGYGFAQTPDGCVFGPCEEFVERFDPRHRVFGRRGRGHDVRLRCEKRLHGGLLGLACG